MDTPRTPRDLRDFIERLRAAGELHEVTAEVDSHLEITDIVDRSTKEHGPALLFTNVRGSKFPVLVNQFASDTRLNIAFGVESIDEVGDRIRELLELTKPPRGLRAKLNVVRTGKQLATSVPPKYVKRAPCQEVVKTGDDVNLDELPILGCWPEDGGRYITLPLVFTKDQQGNRNVGMYRVQQYDRNTCGMHWQIHKDGADAWRHMPPDGRLEVAVVIGTDPIVTYAASCPLPKDIDEMVFAGFARGRRVEMVQCRTIDLQVPANAEFVLEGYITQGELRTEGPFGDHTGYYSLADDYPVFHVTAITHRRDAVYAATVVGVPIQEDLWLGKATERIFLPLLQMVQHEVIDYDLPAEGVFHGCCIVSIAKRFPGHAQKIMHAIWGTALLSLTKSIIVVDETVDVHDYDAVARAIAAHYDPSTGTDFTRGPIDVLDHAPTRMGFGGKIGIDATTPWGSEGRSTPSSDVVDPAAINAWAAQAGATACHVVAGGAEHRLVICAVEKHQPWIGRDLLRAFAEHPSSRGVRCVVVVDSYVDVHALGEVAFRAFGNTDPVRDGALLGEHGQLLCLDATTKLAGEGYTRDWPADIVMTEAIKQRVDERWEQYGIPTPGARTKPLVGLAEGERRIPDGARARGRDGAGNAAMVESGRAAVSAAAFHNSEK
jgi:4-hydroxy-3-polyprenylbenzoate decarboxylase